MLYVEVDKMKTVKKNTAHRFVVNGQFVPVGVKTPDSKNRICLGGRIGKLTARTMKVDAYQVFIGEDGDILLRPTVNVPSRETWIYQNPAVLKKIRHGLVEAKEGKLEKVDDVDKFIEKL